MAISFNPFSEYGVTDYAQFKKFPFLESESITQIKNMIKSRIRDNFRFADRTLLMGEPGIGKTTALYYAYDILCEAKCDVYLFDKFFIDAEDFQNQMKISINEASKKPIYILVDFPDTVNSANYKKFLDYINTLMRCENYHNINFLFACNISHFSRSLTLSEILNKFFKFRLNRLEEKESDQLISSRLKMADSDNYFDDGVYETVFKYSRGIPRNIICASRVLVDEFIDKDSVTINDAKKILKEEYIDKIIDDREEHPQKKMLYKNIMKLFLNDFHGAATNQTEITNVMRDKLKIGKNKSFKLLSDLYKFGLLEYYKGGKNNAEKIWSVKI